MVQGVNGVMRSVSRVVNAIFIVYEQYMLGVSV